MQEIKDNISLILSNKELDLHINFCAPILNLTNDIIFILDLSSQIKLANNFAKSYYNFKDEDLRNKYFTSIKNLPKSFNLIIKKLKLLDHSLPTIKITSKDLEIPEKEINWTISYLTNNKKIPIGIMLVGKFHLEKFNENRINYLQNCLHTIIDNIPGDVYWKNTNGVYLGCNNSMVAKASVSHKEDIIGKTDAELWPDCTFWHNDQKIIASKQTMRVQETVTVNTGENLYLISVKTPLQDHNNKVIGIVSHSLDVTEIINAKAKAEAANNVKNQFLLNMQHDIKAPISNIIGLANIMSSIENTPTKIREYIGYIKISSERLMGLVVDILNNCDLENKSTPHPEWKFNLIELIQKTIDLNIIPIQEKGLNIIINHDYKISKHLIGHRDKLHRIIVNLFDNSLKFTPSGNITITTKLLKTLEYPRVIIELSIKDTGIGIPADKHEAIFERFTRLSPSGSNSYSGLGLGLCMVKQLAKEIDGEIHVKSTVNQGSCFTCVFPCKVGFLEEYDA
jgi:signal transduction histidine kinase